MMLTNDFEQLNIGVQGCTSCVVLESNGTGDMDKLAILNSLMPLYHKLGKFIDTIDGFKTCATNIAILHAPLDCPIQGFDRILVQLGTIEMLENLARISQH